MVLSSNICFTGRSKLYNLKAYASDVKSNQGAQEKNREFLAVYKKFGYNKKICCT